ncbi:nucleotide sugar dehydrogenase [Sediminispirochaeta bajacaliforniensis]|uniref:nucleotide sugar dehydrogenase n=1 Tax=Sediminispirochaeta bajacaliforniensis TaxID=148 RepID=UPI0003697E5C|nr:nucleotide sugar dehydrogenase [Sediminispirochaeta bajacaliforniensis]
MENRKIAVVGFGYIGSVIGSVLADRGYTVMGVEPNQRIVDAIAQGRSPFAEPGLEELVKKGREAGRLFVGKDPSVVADCKTIVITVGTPLSGDHDPDLSQIRAAAEMIAPYVCHGALVMLKSTVPPNTTEGVVGQVLADKKVELAFCPERLAEGKAIGEFTAIPVVVGGVTESATKRAAAFWREALGVEVIEVGNARAAEMVKLADNLWIDLNIALAGELAKVADRLNIDVLDVIRAANSLPKGTGNVNILIPSVGVGGYCLTKDPWFVHRLGKNLGLELLIPPASRNVNDSMPTYSVELIKSFLQGRGKPTAKTKVAVMGIAFKNNTGDCRFTPTKPVIEALQAEGYVLQICDPWVEEHDIQLVTELPVSKDVEDTIRDADCVAFLAGHKQFHDIPIKQIVELANPGALIFDGRMFFSKEKIREMESVGLHYKGVGR